LNADFDTVFVGGGLAATRLLLTMPEGFGRVAIIDPDSPSDGGGVHWSYWASGPTPYDPFTIGEWSWAAAGTSAPQPLHPRTLRLVRSIDVLGSWSRAVDQQGVERIRARARRVERLASGSYLVHTDAGDVAGRWVFDSACDIEPVFPASDRPGGVVSGVGLRVIADHPVFNTSVAVLFDPLNERSFAYVLPLTSTEALAESASMGRSAVGDDPEPVLDYLRRKFPGTRFSVESREHGVIPLGFAPRRTVGPRHVLLGTKRGLVKPSAGYGIRTIVEDTDRLVRKWQASGRPAPTRRAALPWRLFDASFLRLIEQDPGLAIPLLNRVTSAVPLSDMLGLLSEDVSLVRLWPALRAAAPLMVPGARRTGLAEAHP
jgi:lycopene beta-cyclase